MNQNTQDTAIEKTEQEDRSVASFCFDILEMMAWAIFVMLIIFSFGFRLCRVEGSSMENTLQGNQLLLIHNIAYTPKQDDIIVFHLTQPEINMEKTVVKRVIATGGQHIEINFKTTEIKVDGVIYADSHKVLKNLSGTVIDRYTLIYSNPEHYDPTTGIFSATVPEGSLFVMGDNRNNSNDSRNPDIGFVDERCVLGKVIFSLTPFGKIP